MSKSRTGKEFITSNIFSDDVIINWSFFMNYMQSPPDSRDWVLESFIKTNAYSVPAVFDLRDKMRTVRDQLFRGTCGAFVASCIGEYLFNAEFLSPEFIYFHRENKPASGMCGRTVFKIMQKIGTVKEIDYKYQKNDNICVRPSKKLYKKAERFRISHYARIETIEGVKTALVELGPCYLSLPMYSTRPKFWLNDDSNIKKGHAVTIIGYNHNGFILRNSWGSEWNLDGYIEMPYSEWNYKIECWTAINEKKKEKTGCIIS